MHELLVGKVEEREMFRGFLKIKHLFSSNQETKKCCYIALHAQTNTLTNYVATYSLEIQGMQGG